jgi:hypothetical protein
VEGESQTFLDRMQRVDRRVLYALIFASVIIPLFVPLSLPVPVTPETQTFFDAVEALPDSSIVMLPFDFWPSTLAETEPMAVVGLRHLFRKHCYIVGLSNVGMGGPSIAERLLDSIGHEFGRTYGIDYVNLGYKPDYRAVMLGMGTRISDIFPTDYRGTPLDEIPLMRRVPNYDSVTFIFIVSDNVAVDYWVGLVNARYGIPMGAGVTAVMAPKSLSFVQAGQLVGLLGGMKGCAEYENLLGRPDRAIRGMDSQSMIHLLIVLFIIMGNIGYLAGKRRSRPAAAGGRTGR